LKGQVDHHRKLCLASVREARPEEARRISSLFLEWLNFGTNEGRLKEIRKSIGAHEIIVSQDRRTNDLSGFIHGIIHNDPISGAPLVYITAFYVRKEFRGMGLGSMMLRLLLKRAIAKGVVGAEVATSQPKAIRLYKKFGFSQYKAEIGEIQLELNLKKREGLETFNKLMRIHFKKDSDS
jgi:ribosomal protein S18 acetylase RimI-like enzyme